MTRRATATWGILVGLLLAAMDGTVVATALPRILEDLSGFDLYFLPNAAFMLCQTISTPLWGRLSDIHGRGRFHLMAIGILLVGSILCGLSNSMLTLSASRAVQGLGAGGLFALSFTMVADLYELERRARMQGAISSVWGVAALAGPFLGEWLTHAWSWRAVFWINIPIGLVSAALVQSSWHQPAPGKSGKTDLAGAVLLAAASAALLGFFGMAGNRGWTDPRALGSLAAALALVVVLVAVERKKRNPFISYDLYRIRLFATGAVTGVFAMMCMFDAILHVPLLVAGLLGRSLRAGGLMLTVMMVPWMVCSGATRVLLNRFSYRSLAATGMLLAGGAYLLLVDVSPGMSLWRVVGSMSLLGTGLGLTVAPLLIAAQNAVPKDRLGAATSLTQFTRSMGAGLGLAVMGSLMVSAFGGQEPESLIRFRSRLDSAALQAQLAPLADGLHYVFVAGVIAAACGVVAALAVPAGRAAELKRVEPVPVDPVPAPKL